MASSAEARLALISATGWRLLFILILLVTLARLIPAHHYIAALTVILASALLGFDLWRGLRRRPEATNGPADAAVLQAPRQLEAALALIDTVTVALFVIDADDRIRFMNRAARLLAGFEAGRLQDIAQLGEDGAATILRLPVGGRQLVATRDGRSLLAWVGSIRHARAAPQRLVSLQAVTGELDAVQVGAWHAMTRVLAHEMMNSLTPIASMAESVESRVETGGFDPKTASAVATIARRSRHLMDFVERYRAIVDLPRPNPEPVRVADILAEISRLIGLDLGKRKIGFDVKVQQDGMARLDRVLVEQAIVNLIKNAADAVGGTADPTIMLVGICAPDAFVIEIHDNGCGIEEDLLEDVFVPFFTTKPGGAGIGLALAQQIALAHGGSLTAHRAHPTGSIFRLRLPPRP